MKKTIKNIASVAGIGIFSLFAIASVDDESTTSSMSEVRDTKAEFSVTASEITKAFNTNEVGANLKYENKVGEVTGTVDSITENFGRSTVLLKGTFGALGHEFVAASFGKVIKQKEELATLKPGQRVTIKGECEGMSFNVEFKHCVIVTK